MSRQEHQSAQDKAAIAAAAVLDSTHGPAAQASAARVIRLLRSVYPNVSTQISDTATAAAAASTAESTAQEIRRVQKYLLDYLDSKINPPATATAALSHETEETILARKHRQIVKTIELIDFINGSSEYAADDKIRVLKQMRSIANTFPGSSEWNNDHHNWSKNSIIDRDSKRPNIVTASAADTLNLVCTALLDRDRYFPPTEGPIEADERKRIASFFSQLLNLQTQFETGQFQKCSTGRQHDLLFLLNHAFLDKPCSEPTAAPIVLIEDVSTFSFDLLSSWLLEQMESLPSEEKEALILHWFEKQSAPMMDDDTLSPVRSFLRKKYPSKPDLDAQWEAACHGILSEKWIAFGLYPDKNLINSIVKEIDAISPPISETTHALFLDIKKAKPTVPSGAHATSAAAATAAIGSAMELAILRDAVLKKIQNVKLPLEYAHVIENFYTLDALFQMIYHSRHLTVFWGENEQQFHDTLETAKNTVKEILETFLALDDAGLKAYANYETHSQKLLSIKTAYFDRQTEFNKEHHIDFVQNFFAMLKLSRSESEGEALWAQLKNLTPITTRKNPKPVNPVLLTEEEIDTWYKKNRTDDEMGRSFLDISSYECNRILLHALLVSPEKWSSNFQQILLMVTDWLSQPGAAEDSKSLRALKASYPVNLSKNLNAIAHLLLNAPTPEEKERILSEFPVFQPVVFEQILNWCSKKPFSPGLCDFDYCLSPKDSLMLVEAAKGNWSSVIRDWYGVIVLFRLPPEQIEAILALIKEPLPVLGSIKNIVLTLYHLGENERPLFIEKIKNTLPSLITNLENVASIAIFLTTDERDLVFQAVRDIFPDAKNELAWLPEFRRIQDFVYNDRLAPLTSTQYAFVLKALTHCFPWLHPKEMEISPLSRNLASVRSDRFSWNISAALEWFCMLMMKTKNPEHKNIIFEKAQPYLPALCVNLTDFSCVAYALSPEQKVSFFEAIKTRLPERDTINSAESFFHRMSVLPSEEEKASVFEACRTKIPEWLKQYSNTHHFCYIVKCLTPDQRKIVIDELINDGLVHWFDLNAGRCRFEDILVFMEYMTPMQSTRLLNAFNTPEVSYFAKRLHDQSSMVFCLPLLKDSCLSSEDLKHKKENRQMLLGFMHEQILKIIKQGGEYFSYHFGSVLHLLEPSDLKVFLEKLKVNNRLQEFFPSLEHLGNVIYNTWPSSITHDDKKEVIFFDIMKDHIIALFEKGETTLPGDARSIMSRYGEEHPRRAFFLEKIVSSKLSAFCDLANLGIFFEALTAEEIKIVLNALKNQLPELMRQSADWVDDLLWSESGDSKEQKIVEAIITSIENQKDFSHVWTSLMTGKAKSEKVTLVFQKAIMKKFLELCPPPAGSSYFDCNDIAFDDLMALINPKAVKKAQSELTELGVFCSRSMTEDVWIAEIKATFDRMGIVPQDYNKPENVLGKICVYLYPRAHGAEAARSAP